MYRLYDPETHGFAIAEYNPGATSIHQQITIKPGSQLAANDVDPGFIPNQREKHLKSGNIVLRGDYYVVLNDISFSLSGSAAMVMGRNPTAGADRWEHIQSGKSLRVIMNDQGQNVQDDKEGELD
ncbi:DUF4357 domain-containing protein [Paenibacillus sp.]|uniref:DUF4357 domain-containing protein n=1 Tax=Paenibacillus sp. TaxID=58172 RepID=UPI003568E42A